MKALVIILTLGVAGGLAYLIFRKREDQYSGEGNYYPDQSANIPPRNACSRVVGTAAEIYSAAKGIPNNAGASISAYGANSACKLADNAMKSINLLASSKVNKDLQRYGVNLANQSAKIAVNSAVFIPKVTIKAGATLAKAGAKKTVNFVKSIF